MESKEEIGKDFEEFVNTLDQEKQHWVLIVLIHRTVFEVDSTIEEHHWYSCCKGRNSFELCPCIVSIQRFGKDVLFDIISRWYDPTETAKTTIEGLIGTFNEDAEKYVVMVNECHDRAIDTVNKINEMVTASEVVVNHKQV